MKKNILLIGFLILLLLRNLSAVHGINPNATATISIYADDSTTAGSTASFISSIAGAHAFIVIENTSQVSFEIGEYNVKPNEQISISKFGNIDEHDGIYYNLETLTVYYDGYQNSVYLTEQIDSTDIESIDTYVDNNDSYGAFQNNCASFSTDVWNLVSNRTLNARSWGIDQPDILAADIETYSYSSGVSNITYNRFIGYDYYNAFKFSDLYTVPRPNITFPSISTNSITVKYQNLSDKVLYLYADIGSTATTYIGILIPDESTEITYSNLLEGTSYFFSGRFEWSDYSDTSVTITYFETTDTDGPIILPWSVTPGIPLY